MDGADAIDSNGPTTDPFRTQAERAPGDRFPQSRDRHSCRHHRGEPMSVAAFAIRGHGQRHSIDRIPASGVVVCLPVREGGAQTWWENGQAGGRASA